MPHKIRRAEDTDAKAVEQVSSHFVRTSFAAFPSEEVDESFFH